MNLITKLLMENKVDIGKGFVLDSKRTPVHILHIEAPGIDKLLSKKELLEEVPDVEYVSTLEWELLNFWKANGVVVITKLSDNSVRLLNNRNKLDEDYDIFYQEKYSVPVFTFLKEHEYYKLDDLISHCALIEG